MEWQAISGGLVKKFLLEDGTPIVALIKNEGEDKGLIFCSDTGDLAAVGPESERLGRLTDLIDDLRPEDIIDICCFIERASKES